MRCPSCNKFATYDTSAEPEIDVEVSSVESVHETGENEPEEPDPKTVSGAEAEITGNVRIVLTAECCGDELKEATFEINAQAVVERADGCECDFEDLSVEPEGLELTERRESTATKTSKSGAVSTRVIPARYQKQFYGYSATLVVSCVCGKSRAEISGGDDIQASSMDGLC